MQFQKIDSTNDIQEIIHNAFNMKLDINGSWGYDQNNPTIINMKLKLPTPHGLLSVAEAKCAALSAMLPISNLSRFPKF